MIMGVLIEKSLGVIQTRAAEVFLRPVEYILPFISMESRDSCVDSELLWEEEDWFVEELSITVLNGLDVMIDVRRMVR